MRGALEAGGKVSGVLADSLEKATMSREHRSLLIEGRLVLMSPYDPSAGFNVGNAMQRNKLIYALADASLVVSSDLNKGGTWAGASEQLDKLKFVPVYVRSTSGSSPGLDALRKKGAIPWPNPTDTSSLEAVFDVAIPASSSHQVDLSLSSNDEPCDSVPAALVTPETGQVLHDESKPLAGTHAAADAKPATRVSEDAPSVAQGEAKEEQNVLEKKTSAAGYTVKQRRLFD
jgi:predicted Rossmann fold nucleotide-binding protein DprA/Smf involved in DNA uptake